MRILSFDHVHLHAVQPEATIEFFREHFGAERVGGSTNVAGDKNHFLILGGQLLVVSAAPTAAGAVDTAGPSRRHGIAHVGFNVASVDASLTELAAAGVTILEPAQQSGLIRYAYIAAPDGVVIELTEYVVPRRLKPLVPLLAGYNKLVHAIRRRLLLTATGKS
jgi:catechol 2,3-dioxygenase-like lactoylglutathione lyase family enzyme